MNRMQHGRRGAYQTTKIEKGTAKKVVKRVWKYLKKYPRNLFVVSLSILISVSFSLGLPILLKIAIDDYLNIDSVNILAIGLIAGSMALGSIITAVMGYFQQYLMSKVASKVATEIRKDAFDKLVHLPISYFDENPHGVIMSNLTNDVETISMALSQVVPQFITAGITITGAFVLMVVTSWQLSIVAFAIIPFMIFGTALISKKSAKHFQTQQVKLGTINGIVKENINGLKAVKLYGQEEEMIKRFEVANRQLQTASFRGQIYSGLLMPLIRLIDNILYALLVAVGAILNIRYGIISVGQIQSMINFTRLSTRPINSIAQVYNILQIAVAGGERVFKVIDEKDEYVNDVKTKAEISSGKVAFEGVSFAYTPEKMVLKNLDFCAEAGHTIAIVGPTGGGKTTIINLLMRFYDPTKGKIIIDNQDITQVSKDDLRSQIGIVLQSTYLFRGTVLENIRYAKPDATKEEVIEAAKQAHVHEIIDRLPRKYETRVKEGGSNFSHGERQLLSIARTILANPKILILDEATSSVDTRTETNIQKSIQKLVENRTSIIIAHRLQTIRNAHKIIVIRDGQIYEMGSHDELIEKKGFYYEMYQSQFRLE